MDENTRLCEECGYIVDGLPDGTVCPECGKSVPRTRDERRPGSAWQRSRGVLPWMETSWGMLRRPASMMDRARIDAATSRQLRSVNVIIGAALLTLAGVRVLGLDQFPQHLRGGGFLVGVLVSGIVVGTNLLFVLTAIEARGIRFFGARRGWRITPAVAATICGHASIGWAIGGLLVLGVTAYFPVHWSPRAGFWQRFFFVAWIPSAALAFFIGMLVFESLVYVGMRRCRYANLPDSVSAGDGERVG